MLLTKTTLLSGLLYESQKTHNYTVWPERGVA